MPTESIISLQGRKMLALETLWLVMVSIVSKPCDRGNFMIKSMAMVWNRREEVGVIRNKGG